MELIIDILKGTGSIILALTPLLIPQVREFIIIKYQHSLDKNLEDKKARNERKNYISKVRFDKEFEIYAELSDVFFELVVNVSTLIPAGFHQVIADEEKREKVENQNYDKTKKSANIALATLHKNAVFIKKEFYTNYNDILKLSRQQINIFSKRWNVGYLGTFEDKKILDSKDYARTVEINNKFDELNDQLRDYLASLEVIA